MAFSLTGRGKSPSQACSVRENMLNHSRFTCFFDVPHRYSYTTFWPFPGQAEGKAKFCSNFAGFRWVHRALIAFSPCLSRKRPSRDSACACNGLFPLPVKEKAIMRLSVRLRCPFPPACREKNSMELGMRLRWPFPPACQGKGRLMDLVCFSDGLSPLPVEEKELGPRPRPL